MNEEEYDEELKEVIRISIETERIETERRRIEEERARIENERKRIEEERIRKQQQQQEQQEQERRRLALIEEQNRLINQEDDELAAVLLASRLEYENSERIRREEEERILREIEIKRKREEEEKERKRIDELERKRREEERLRREEMERKRREEEERKRIEEERARIENERKRIEAERKRIEEQNRLMNQEEDELAAVLLASRLDYPPNNDNNHDHDDLAVRASLDDYKSEMEIIRRRELINKLLQSFGEPPPGRVRCCFELPKDSGGLIVGMKHKFAKSIAQESGGNCRIQLLPRNISLNFEGLIGDCLLIEADAETFLDIAESKLMTRVAGIFISPDAINSSAQNKRKKIDELRRLPTFQPTEQSPRAAAAPPPIPTTTTLSTTTTLTSTSRPIPKTNTNTLNNLRPEIRRHIIIDNSNLFIGAQSYTKINNRADPTVRINAKKISNILLKSTTVDGVRVVAGSKPPSNGKVWQHWESAGYRVKVCSRDIDTGSEDLVDEFLHAQAMDIVLQRQTDQPGENTLVLCTGDGNSNHGFSNFVEVAKNTARMGWRVEIWAWNHSCSNNFRNLTREYPDRVTLHLWDNHSSQILFHANVTVENDSSPKSKNSGNNNNSAKSQTTTNNNSDKKSPTSKQRQNTKQSTKASPAPIPSLKIDSNTIESDDDDDDDDQDDDDNSCIVCMENPRSHIILPCFHFVSCRECIGNFGVGTPCPVCRAIIERTREVFLT